MIIPEIGQIVHVRSRQYLVEAVRDRDSSMGDTIVSLSCLEDDAQGQPLQVFWEREMDAPAILNSERFDAVSAIAQIVKIC